MKYIKKFEKITNGPNPEVGDYVIIDLIPREEEVELREFIINNVGQIIKDEGFSRLIKYTNTPGPSIIVNYFDEEKNGWKIWVGSAHKIIGYGKTPEEARMKVTANKYNI